MIIITHELNSKKWYKVEYNENSKLLVIRGKKDNSRNKTIVSYKDIPMFIFENLINSKNPDKYIENEIKLKYKSKTTDLTGLVGE